jgi:hypothetical protein
MKRHASPVLYCYFTAALLLLTVVLPLTVVNGCFTAALLLLYCSNLLLYCCFTAALLLLHCCFTARNTEGASAHTRDERGKINQEPDVVLRPHLQ